MNYQSLQPIISRYFRSKGIGCEAHRTCDVVYSPFSETVGPDILRCTLIGEIKDDQELKRDLSSKYWSSWNSPNQQFGGKRKDYLLQNDLPSTIPNDGKTKGWIAVIFGQLEYYRKTVGLPDAWLIVENYTEYKTELEQALSFLKENNKINDYVSEIFEELGFIHIFYHIQARMLNQ
jgi:hypothetical protein